MGHRHAFRPQWLQPLEQLTNGDLGGYRQWLEREMGAMTPDDRERAKRVFRAVRGELRSRRRLARQRRRVEQTAMLVAPPPERGGPGM